MSEDLDSNPLDFVEEIAERKTWSCFRIGPAELLLEIPGSWRDYECVVQWADDLDCLGVTFVIQPQIPDEQLSRLPVFLSMVNEQTILGHFVLMGNEDIVFRYTLPVSLTKSGRIPVLENIMRLIVEECDRFYPAFQFLLFGKKEPEEAIAAAMLDTEGEA